MGLIALTIIAVGAIFAYLIYNKPAIDVKNSAGKKVIAEELYNSYIKNSENAKKSYSDKILEVNGEVVNKFQNQQKQMVILLASGASGAFINCTMEGADENIHIGTQTSIKGICTGIGDGDLDLQIPGDVYLIRCYESK